LCRSSSKKHLPHTETGPETSPNERAWGDQSRIRFVLLLVASVFILAGCATWTSASTRQGQTDPSVDRDGSSWPPSPPAATTESVAPLESKLIATVTARLPPTAAAAPPAQGGIGIHGVEVLPLGNGPDGRSLFAVVSQGMRNFSTHQTQFVAIYAAQGTSGFQQLSQLDLPASDFIGPRAIKEVHLDAQHVWLQVFSSAGANSGCFDVLNFDGTRLQDQAHQCLADPNRSHLADVDGDGRLEVILDQSDNLIFCHACGVAKFRFKVLKWNGSAMSQLDLAPLPSSAPTDRRDPTNRAVQLAQAGLWKEAEATISPVQAQAPGDPLIARDAGLIRLYADAFGTQAQKGPYPLLDDVFYGDYTSALNVLRPLTPAQIFSFPTPLIAGTVAHGFEKSLEQQIITSATLALQAEPDLAAAYYLRGWATYLANPKDPQALRDVARAAQLAPGDQLFAESLNYLRGQESANAH
jgi:hypothetical protein